MIREAQLDDVEAVVKMGVRFSQDSGVVSVDPVRVTTLTADFMVRDDATVLLSENGHGPNGLLALLVYDHPFSGERTASEVVWWVEPEATVSGVRLLLAGEKWAKEHGATLMHMVALEGTKAGPLYERLNYKRIESSYQRRL